MPSHLQTSVVANFSCLGAECPDTCCQGWGMQLTVETIEKFRREAPELLDAVTNGESEYVMKRDPATDRCVKFDQGWCSIHRDYGDGFLGDACHFYPRITRALGETVITSAALSCPKTAQQMLYETVPFALQDRREIRQPYSLKNYLPTGMDEEEALAIHQAFLELAGDEAVSAEHGLMRVSAVARALEMQPVAVWKDALALYIPMADGRIPAVEAAAADLFNLLQALQGLAAASASVRAPLAALIAGLAEKLGVDFTKDGRMNLAEDSVARAVQVMAQMRAQSVVLQPVLRRYLQAQLSQALFPFAGLGQTLSERISIIGVRLATLKLALTTLGEKPTPEEVVPVVQTLARFMDHLADPTLSLRMYEETGWVREPRLRALVGC